jgi:hypothetical protein
MIAEREQLVAYLLGELPEEEQLRLEQLYFASDAAYEELLVVEDELAYDYVQGRLPAGRRRRFEATIGATDRGRQNIEFARALLEQLRGSRRASVWPGRYWAVGIAAVLALVTLPLWLALQVTRLSSQLEKLRADAAASEASLKRELLASRAAAAELPAVSFLLTPGLSRSSGGPARLRVPVEASAVLFHLVRPPGATPGDYVITVLAVGGIEVWSQAAAFAGPNISVQMPSKFLPPGDYDLTLRRQTSGEQAPELARYSFRLVAK